MKNNPRTIINVLFKYILESFNECKKEILLKYNGELPTPKLNSVNDFLTLTFNLGRQRGHTTLIKTYAQPGDLVICINLDQVNSFEECGFQAITIFKFFEDFTFGELRLNDESTIWINDYSSFKSDIKGKLNDALSIIATENTIVKLG
jgi:hypothetical protein